MGNSSTREVESGREKDKIILEYIVCFVYLGLCKTLLKERRPKTDRDIVSHRKKKECQEFEASLGYNKPKFCLKNK